MKRALMYASVASMIQQFNMNNIALLQELGYKVDVACNFEFGNTISQEKVKALKTRLKEIDVDFYHIPVPRKIIDIKNLKLSYSQTKELMNKNQYQLIHCHSPIGGIICRIANKNSNNYENTRMIYTAHGFHFFKGNNPLKNFLFRNIERYGAKYTDTLITINKEDYAAAKKFKLRKNGTVEYVLGVGIDIDKINSIQGNKEELCKELNIPSDSTLLLSVGELSKRKNHKVIIHSLSQLSNNVHYLICGQGQLESYLLTLAKELNVEDRLHLLGYRTNIPQIMKSCDIFVFPSLQEGLPVALMEAMACGLPCVASNIRGNTDLIESGINSLLCSPIEYKEFLNAIKKIDEEIKDKFSKLNIFESEKYSDKIINEEMRKIYNQKKEKNVLHLLKSNNFSGAENVVCQIIKMFDEEYNMFYCSRKGDIKKEIEKKNIKYIGMDSFNRKELIRIIKKNDIDIIHAHDPGACFLAATTFHNKPIVAHIHGNHDNMKVFSFKSLAFFLSAFRYKKIIWVSESCLRDYFFKKYLPNRNIILVNVIDDKEVRNRCNEGLKDKFNCIYLGRLSPEKNPLKAIEVIKKVVETIPNYKAVFVGDGILREQCHEKVKREGLCSNITFIGFQSNPIPYLNNSDILLMTSIYEGTPMSALEASSLGKPIVSTETDGLLSLIECDVNGYYSNDNNQLAKYLILLYENQNKYKNMSLNSVKRFEEMNDLKEYKGEIKKIYEQV